MVFKDLLLCVENNLATNMMNVNEDRKVYVNLVKGLVKNVHGLAVESFQHGKLSSMSSQEPQLKT